MFTIEVKKKEKDEEFSFKDLEMFHQECLGGKIEQEKSKDTSFPRGLTCQRCGGFECVDQPGVVEIILTSTDGQKRDFKVKEQRICVIQKD